MLLKRKINNKRTIVIIIIFLSFLIFAINYFLDLKQLYSITLFTLSVILSLQAIFTIIWMLYAWENPKEVSKHKSPNRLFPPSLSFSIIVPARSEKAVIKDTILALERINYPDNLKEIIIVCRSDDKETINEVKRVLKLLKKDFIHLVIFNSSPINKPHALNVGLKKAKNEIIAVFDSEDEPHPDILKIINTVILKDKVDVVQSGIQLMNYRSYWFSTLNILEYYLWFKSGLHFFAQFGNIIPLGGNTVFIKRKLLKDLNGWDENCLTEDAELGIRLVVNNAKIRVIYDEKHTTQEETPSSVWSFIRQRTRWNQGFLQVFLKGVWTKLPSKKQKITALYFLLSPLINAFLILYIPITIFLLLNKETQIAIAIFSFLPFDLLLIQILIQIIALYEFTKDYQLKYPLYMPLKIIITYFPYQFLLSFSAFRAVYRIIINQTIWEKTLHKNLHRKPL